MPTFSNLPPHIYFFIFLLGALLLSFLLFFFVPALRVSGQLSRIIKKLEALRGKPEDNLGRIFEQAGVLGHLWNEYADTLHGQTTDNSLPPVTRLRSTMPAGIIFRSDIIVDIPLRADFFKHLPGLFTGIGIIGTFYGLLLGLQSFEVSENAAVIHNSLNMLLHGVWEAFLVSALAIALAMVITFVEKLVIAGLNGKVEKVVQLLDGLFEGGAGEEYLARLVKASESSSSQTSSLLKGELKQILTELTDRQIAAANAGTTALGDRIVASLEERLKAPLQEISDALKGTRNDQDAASQALLTNVLNTFSQRMQDLFGSQISGINGLQQQTIEALQSAVVTLQEMVANVEAAGQRGTSAMADQLAEAMAATEARQRVMNEKMAEFVDQMRLAIANSQGETQAKLQSTLSELSDRMGALIEELSAQVRSATDTSRRHQDDLAIRSQNIVGQFGSQIEILVDGITRTVAEMKTAVIAMRNTTGESISKLNSGADTLYLAARDFAKAGQGITSTLEKSSGLSIQLTQAANSLTVASTGLGKMFGDYKAARDSILQLVTSLQEIVAQARREASMTSDVIARIEGATAKLVTAQQEADKYLDRVSEVIGEAHESFSAGMTKSVGEANRDFHQALSDSVKLLREGIQELEETLGSVAGPQ